MIVQRTLQSFGLALIVALATVASAQEAPHTLRLPESAGAHWFWLGDRLLQRTALFDADDGGFLGMLSAGLGAIDPSFSHARAEIYLPETYYARRTRGQRSDLVTVYDARDLTPLAEIAIPPKRADHASWVASSALSDDERFLAIFNLTPASSISIVDVVQRRFVVEIPTPGCSLVYAAGTRVFLALCQDGALLTVTLDDEGRPSALLRSVPFFDPIADPVTEKAARDGDRWLFVSFLGVVHPIDLSQGGPVFEQTWSLADGDEAAAGWRIGGHQHLASHPKSRRLFALMHQGGPGSHKDPGQEVWVYNLDQRRRVQRIALRNPGAAFAGQILDAEPGGWLDGALQSLLPNDGVSRIAVTRDDAPVLITASDFPPVVSIHDATTGEFLRDVAEPGVAAALVSTP